MLHVLIRAAQRQAYFLTVSDSQMLGMDRLCILPAIFSEVIRYCNWFITFGIFILFSQSLS
jgi:hypothetical protein